MADITLESLAEQVASLAVDVQRVKDMIQTLSESHDQNRRELQFATTRATDLVVDLNNQVGTAHDLLGQVKALREGRG